MKRIGADSRRRSLPTLMQDARPRGPLTEEEISAVRRAYENGCRGEIIIGTRGDERVVTMLLPDSADNAVSQRMAGIKHELKQIGCDGIWRVRAAPNPNAP